MLHALACACFQKSGALSNRPKIVREKQFQEVFLLIELSGKDIIVDRIRKVLHVDSEALEREFVFFPEQISGKSAVMFSTRPPAQFSSFFVRILPR